MELQPGRDDYPVIDQLSEGGFINLTFEMADLAEDEEYHRFLLAASFADEVVGMGVVVQKGIKAGFDSNMDLNKANVYKKGVRLFRAGEQSDRLTVPSGAYMVQNSPQAGWSTRGFLPLSRFTKAKSAAPPPPTHPR